MANVENNYKVRLVPIAALQYGSDPASIRTATVAFDVTPTFSESGSVEYSAITPVHLPGAIQVYKHTNSRSFEIGAHLVSRNVADALKNMQVLQMLRSWRLPYFGATDTVSFGQQANRSAATGSSTTTTLSAEDADAQAKQRIRSQGVQLRGAPPDVLYMYAYSTNGNDTRSGAPVNLNRIPVVMTSLNITYPDDVDYIPVYDMTGGNGPTTTTEPFPRKLDVSISLVETHSPYEYQQFDLQSYKLGNLASF